MQIGIQLAQNGSTANPAAVRSFVTAAESLGYHSVWVMDRLIAPLEPSVGYAGSDLELPREHGTSLEPLSALTYAAALSERVQLGTSVLVGPWYRPALLARSLTTLDVLSEGRLVVGLGLGWSPEEFAAAGVPMQRLGARQEELLDVLDAWWGPNPVSYAGTEMEIAPSGVGLKPVRRPPVLLAAFSQQGLERVARRADGWLPVAIPVSVVPAMFAEVRDLAASYGRNPDALQLVVRADIHLSERARSGDRASYHGSLDQVAEDLRATQRAGVHEVVLALNGDRDVDETLEVYAVLADAVELASVA